MGLTEKTLEINITHELLSVGHGIWNILWNTMPSPMIPTTVSGPPIYAAGLSLKDELQYGCDVSLDLPAMAGYPARVAFLQFKMGKQLTYSRYAGSMFAAPTEPKKRHILFGINNNSDFRQHSKLRATGVACGVPQCAIYALPLFTDERQVRGALGNLLANTLFFSVPDVDAAAVHDPIVDGVKRAIAVANSNPALREIRSQPVRFDARDIGGQFIGEIAAVRLRRALAAWTAGSDLRSERRRMVGRRISNAVAGFLSDLVGVDLDMARQAFDRQVRIRETAAASDRRQVLRDKRIFDIAETLRPVFARLDTGDWLDESSVTYKTEFFAETPTDGIRWRFPPDIKGGSPIRLSYIVV